MKNKPLSKRQMKALDGSIKKWEKIVGGTGVDEGAINCPCCQKYFANYCNFCPIAIYVDNTECYETPYEAYVSVFNDVFNEKSKRLAQAELGFLREVKAHFERLT